MLRNHITVSERVQRIDPDDLGSSRKIPRSARGSPLLECRFAVAPDRVRRLGQALAELCRPMAREPADPVHHVLAPAWI